MPKNDVLFVNIDEFDINNVFIIKTQKHENSADISNGINYMPYRVMYRYSLDDDTQYTTLLRIYCPDMVVSNYKKKLPNYKYTIFPFNYKSRPWEKVTDIINSIKIKVRDMIMLENSINVINNLPDQQTKDYIHVYIPINCNTKTLNSDVIKLEGISKNNINTKINNLDELNNLLTNYAYNNTKTGSHFCSNVIIQFKSSLTYSDQTEKITFMPLVNTMELYYNKIKYIPSINIENKIIPSDRILVL